MRLFRWIGSLRGFQKLAYRPIYFRSGVPSGQADPSLRGSMRLSERGWTLVELMLVTAMIGIITPAITFLFIRVSQGMAADEMHGQLKTLNESTMLRLHESILANKHMFQNDVAGSGVSFLKRVQLTGGVPAAPPTLVGSRLAESQAAGVSSFSPSATPPCSPASFGNSLFFAAYDVPTTIRTSTGGLVYTAPLTVTGTGITYVGGQAATMIVDLYRFYYYYLTTSDSTNLTSGVTAYRLVEWKSIQYADYYQLKNIFTSDPTLGQGVVNWIATAGNFPGGPVSWSYDSSVVDPTQAFYTLSSGSFSTTPVTNPTIYQATWSYMTQIPTGYMSNGFKYGLSPNSAGWAGAPQPVPQYALTGWTSPSPAGFEVGMLGNAGGLQILTRCLLVAKGAAPRIIWNDQTMVHNAKDVW